MSDFKLILGFSPSEKDFISKLSPEDWKEMKEGVYKKQGLVCCGCGWKPDSPSKLQFHLVHLNEEQPKESLVKMICAPCHLIRHFDYAAKNDLLVLVNSCYSQAELVQRCRSSNKTILKDIEEKRIMVLKKKPLEYSMELSESEFNRNDKIKVIFSKNFSWDNSK
jgi:hypothetical protein